MTSPFPIARISDVEQRTSDIGCWWQCSIIVDVSNSDGLFEFENDYIPVMLTRLKPYFDEYYRSDIGISYVGKYHYPSYQRVVGGYSISISSFSYEFLLLFENQEDAIMFAIKYGMKSWISS